MSELLKDKKIVVMGVVNNKSIAWGCAKAMKNSGAKVIFTYQNDRVGEMLKKLLSDDDMMIKCDVSSDEEIENSFKQIEELVGNIDGLVHSIAFAKKDELEGNFSETSRDGFALAHDISAYSFIAVSKIASKLMKNGGSIVTMTYIGSERTIPNYNVMGVAKASLEASVRYLATEFAEDNIRVNAISAGVIKTLASSGIRDLRDLMDRSIDRTPGKKAVTIDEVGNTAAFLVSDLSTGITGEVIYVDKGFHLS